jgi:hypothetical protein
MKIHESSGLAKDATLLSWVTDCRPTETPEGAPIDHWSKEETPRGDHRATSPAEFVGREKL